YSLGNLGNVLAAAGRHDEALAYYRRSVEVREACGDVVRQIDSLESEARLLLKLDRVKEATERLGQAMRLREALGDARAAAAAPGPVGGGGRGSAAWRGGRATAGAAGAPSGARARGPSTRAMCRGRTSCARRLPSCRPPSRSRGRPRR